MADRASLEFNGNWFEQQIARRLSAAFPESRVFHDCRIFSQYKNRFTQIDIIMVHSSGIYVIEAKNWSGYLKGEYDDSFWTGKSHDPIIKTIVNPVDQNFMHIRALKNAMRKEGFRPGRFESYVCVPDITDIYSKCSELCSLSQMMVRLRTQTKRQSALDINYWAAAIENVCLQGI